MVAGVKPKNALHELGYKIFLDRYAQKDMKRTTLAVGDTVIVVVNSETGQREIGHITALALPQITIELLQRGAPLPLASPWKDMPNIGSW